MRKLLKDSLRIVPLVLALAIPAWGLPAATGDPGRLLRARGEFLEEVELFDNHLYGRVRSAQNEERISALQEGIDSRNDRLAWVKDELMTELPPEIREGNNVLMTSLQAEIGRLEGEIGGLQAELRALEPLSILEAGTELLDGARWEADQPSLIQGGVPLEQDLLSDAADNAGGGR